MGTTISKISYKLVFLVLLSSVILIFSGCATQKKQPEAVDKSTLEEPVQPKKIVNAIDLEQDADTYRITIGGNGELTYTSVKQPVPLGVVLYFPETFLMNVPPSITPEEGLVKSVSSKQIGSKKDTLRIAILLTEDAPYTVSKKENAIDIIFSKAIMNAEAKTSTPDASLDKPTASAVPVTVAKTSTPQPVVIEKKNSPLKSANPQYSEKAWVNRLDFLSESNGKSSLAIGTTSPVNYDMREIGPLRLELKLINASIPEYRQRPLITSRFESALDRIMPIQLPTMENFSIITFELREAVPYSIEQAGSLLMVHFGSSMVPPQPIDKSNLPEWKTALDQKTSVAGTVAVQSGKSYVSPSSKVAQSTSGETGSAIDSGSIALEPEQAYSLRRKTKNYTGEKIALDFFQTDVKNVFRILREVSGKNFAIDKDVSGKVTLTLEDPVPWDQVLDLVLRMNQLGMVYEGNIIRIATLTTLKSEDDLRKARIAAAQQAKAQVKALEPISTRYIPISYSNATSEILPHIQNIITKDRGSVTVDAKNNQIIITDTQEKIEQALEIARTIDKVTSQVVIEARIVEVNENFTKELGVSWSSTIGPVSVNDGKSNWTSALSMDYPAATNNGIGFSFAKIAGTPFVLDAKLSALEADGNGKILSAPKIVTLDNKKAMIKQGTEVAYLERDSAGGSSVQFKDVDLLLEVTPHVTPDNRISMSIHITKNDVATVVEGVPSLSVNEADTELLVNDGDTIVIGGIIKRSTTKSNEQFPALGDIPLLGWMFKYQADKVESSELLIFISPRIVRLEKNQAF